MLLSWSLWHTWHERLVVSPSPGGKQRRGVFFLCKNHCSGQDSGEVSCQIVAKLPIACGMNLRGILPRQARPAGPTGRTTLARKASCCLLNSSQTPKSIASHRLFRCRSPTIGGKRCLAVIDPLYSRIDLSLTDTDWKCWTYIGGPTRLSREKFRGLGVRSPWLLMPRT